MKIALAVVAVLSASAAHAVPGFSVPEIDAAAGVGALAVVGAAVALIRERNKR